jgi:glycerate dehydrogenase
MKHRVVFLDRKSLPVRFTRPACAHEYVEHAETAAQEVVARLAGASIAITNKVPLRGPELARLPGLRLIAVAATGYDCVDSAYCREHGIAVANIRNYAVHTVPEHVFALLLALRRNLVGYRAAVAAGAWQRATQFCVFDGEIRDLHGSVLGLVGRGSIGGAVAAIAAAFGMRVVFFDPAHTVPDPAQRSLAALLAEADVISLHCPLTAGTRGMIGEQELRAMKSNAILINTARGGLVDEAALARALREGWIGGAGFDVLTVEPPRDGNVLLELDLPNFILTPHVAWASVEAMEGLADQLTGNIDAWASGTPRNLVP